LDPFDHFIGHDVTARAQNRQAILDDKGMIVLALLVMGVPAQDPLASKVGQNLACRLAIMLRQLLGRLEDVIVYV
jgi:hypothetical protein